MVTGGTGFIGSYIVKELLERGYTVVSYNRDYSGEKSNGVIYVQGELFDLPRLLTTIQSHGVRRVIHTAAMSHPDLSVDMPLTTIAANIEGTAVIFEAARLSQVERVINLSSECAVGPTNDEIGISPTLSPTTPYGVSKATTEMLAGVYRTLYKISVTTVRITEVFGPGNKMPQVLHEAIVAALRKEPLVITGGDHPFQFVHVTDVAKAVVQLLECVRCPEAVYNITGQTRMSVREATDIIASLVPDQTLHVQTGFLPRDIQGMFDCKPAQRDFGYAPQKTFEEHLRDYITWLSVNEY